MKKITILIKPVSSLCNMDCDYCFYKDLSKYRDDKISIMSKETVEAIISKIININTLSTEIEFCFQGGEPLLAGIDFFNYFISFVNEVNNIHRISYSIQTNGILITNEWIELFKRNRFLVGVSLDGIMDVHDKYRRICNMGTHSKVIESITLLQKNMIDFNILSVITSKMSRYAKEIYEFYKKQNYKYIQFIPCLPSVDGVGGLKPKEFAFFYKELFNEYKKDRTIQISLFEQIALLQNGIRECSCGMLGYCSFQIVIEASGDIFPCDFYALKEYCIGNIHEIDLKCSIVSKRIKSFLEEDKSFSNLCDNCQFFKMCQGQCKRQNVCLFDDEYCGYQDLLNYMKDN
ncbi:MAG: radical SAM protein [Coprobacillus sp.]